MGLFFFSMHPRKTRKTGLQRTQARYVVKWVPFLLDVHFSALDSQGRQCLETFFSKRKNCCAPHFWTTDFHILSSYQLANSLWVSFIFSYNVSFFWGLSSKRMGGMILFKLIEMKLYRFLPPCICEHDLCQAWKSAVSFCTFDYFVFSITWFLLCMAMY